MRGFAAAVLAALVSLALVPAPASAQTAGVDEAISVYGTSSDLIDAVDGPSVSEDDAPGDGRVLKVAFPYAKGISETDENGIHSGMLFDWLVEIAKYTNWEYQFVTGEPDALAADAIDGTCDLSGGWYYRDYLEPYLIYPQHAAGANNLLLMTLGQTSDIQSYDLQTLNGKTIAVQADDADAQRRLVHFLEFNGLTCIIAEYPSEARARAALESGAADVVLDKDLTVNEDCVIVARFSAEPFYLAVPEGSGKLCAELDDAMSKIYAADPGFAEELYEKYFPDSYANPVAFTEEDSRFVENAGPVRVALMQDRYPLYYERNGEMRGIVKGTFDLIAERTGLTFEYVGAATYQDAIDLVVAGNADVLGCFMDDEYIASDMGFALSREYATLDEVVLRNRSVEYPSADLVFALLDGKAKPESIATSQIQHYASYEECLAAINSGDADITVVPSSYAEGLYSDNFYANITPVASDHLELSLSIAFARPVDSELYAVISKAVNSFTVGEIDTVLSKNVVSVVNRQVSLQSLVYSNPVAALAIGAVFLLLVVAVVLLVARSAVRNRIMALKLEKAEETGRAKSDFLSRMSHEIRTPMNAIIGLSTIASQSGEATPAIRGSLEKINTSAQFLLALVNDILDMSKIENDKMQLECAPFCLEALANQMESMVGIQAEEKGLSFVTECDVSEGCVVGDSIRIQQVLANLVSNAFKFTDSGGTVTLAMKEVARDDDRVRVRFGVRDTGIGIEPADLDRVFEAFEQAAESRTNVQGTGLGLAISSNLVKMMGGTLKVDSTPGIGSEFYFSVNLPISQECPYEDESGAKGASVSLAGTKLLLAEDNDLNAEIAVALLEMEGVEAVRAENGQRAVDLFAASEPGEFDFVLMDVKMPVMDGLAAARAIRTLDRADASAVPIIAITANTFQEDRESADAAGMDGFVPKPFDAEQLYDALRSFMTAG